MNSLDERLIFLILWDYFHIHSYVETGGPMSKLYLQFFVSNIHLILICMKCLGTCALSPSCRCFNIKAPIFLSKHYHQHHLLLLLWLLACYQSLSNKVLLWALFWRYLGYIVWKVWLFRGHEFLVLSIIVLDSIYFRLSKGAICKFSHNNSMMA